MSISIETPLDQLDFIAFDTETTGCTAATGRMVEIGAVRFRTDGCELDRFQALINPLRPIPWAVTRIHGITDAMVKHCPSEAEILPRFLQFLGDPSATLLLAHNAGFDMAFVGNALGRCNLPLPTHSVLDTVRLARRRAPELPSHALRSLVRSFGLGATTDHRGLSDSVHLMQLFQRLVARPPAIETVGELFQLVRPAYMKCLDEPKPRRGAGRSLGRGWWRAESLGLAPEPLRTSLDNTRTPPPERSADGFNGRDPLIPDLSTAYGRTPDSATADPAIVNGSVEERPSPYVSGDIARQIASMIATGGSISLIYDGGRNAGQRRRVTPVKIVSAVEVNYLFAYCHLDRKQKQFRLDRIRELLAD